MGNDRKTLSGPEEPSVASGTEFRDETPGDLVETLEGKRGLRTHMTAVRVIKACVLIGVVAVLAQSAGKCGGKYAQDVSIEEITAHGAGVVDCCKKVLEICGKEDAEDLRYGAEPIEGLTAFRYLLSCKSPRATGEEIQCDTSTGILKGHDGMTKGAMTVGCDGPFTDGHEISGMFFPADTEKSPEIEFVSIATDDSKSMYACDTLEALDAAVADDTCRTVSEHFSAEFEDTNIALLAEALYRSTGGTVNRECLKDTAKTCIHDAMRVPDVQSSVQDCIKMCAATEISPE